MTRMNMASVPPRAAECIKWWLAAIDRHGTEER
jgi:uncharacterized protein YdhG (YjbR/CyaY superfamily)